MGNTRSANTQALWVGLACFSALFGAGNLIFPSYLGLQSGKNLTAFVMFCVMDVILSCLGYIAESKRPDVKLSTFSRTPKVFYTVILLYTCFLCMIGSTPRTGATSYEIGVANIFPALPVIVYTAIYFLIAFIGAIRPGKVVEIIGKYLTPTLIIGVVIIIVKGFITPLGPCASEPQIDNLFAEGVIQGYQTMDAFATPSLSLVFITGIMAAGFTATGDMTKILMKGSLIASFLLILVYGGLFYLGASLSTQVSPADVDQTSLVTIIVRNLMGQVGLVIFAVVVVLACLTTAIGTISGSSQLVVSLTGGKIKYEWMCIILSVAGFVFSQLSVGAILNMVAPFVSVAYPVFVILIILTLFTNQIKNDNVYIFGGIGAFIFAFADILNVPVLCSLPGDSLMMGWVIPAVICAIIGFFVPSKVNRDPIHAANAEKNEEAKAK